MYRIVVCLMVGLMLVGCAAGEIRQRDYDGWGMSRSGSDEP